MKFQWVDTRWRGLRCLLAMLVCAATPLHAETTATPVAEASTRQILQVSPLAGFQHYAGRALFPLMRVGDLLTLHREPDNPHDPHAVRVAWYGAQIGYAPRADNVDLARLMDRGVAVSARILHLQKSRDPWKRVMMEIYVLEPGQR